MHITKLANNTDSEAISGMLLCFWDAAGCLGEAHRSLAEPLAKGAEFQGIGASACSDDAIARQRGDCRPGPWPPKLLRCEAALYADNLS